MERFTVKLPDDLGIVPKQGYGWPEIAAKLAAYEDAEEQGRLVVLPCKVGTEAWYISYCSPINKWFIATKLFGYEDYASFGKTVFLTREEAEKALEGMG